MSSVPTVFIVDDDEAVRSSLQLLMNSANLTSEAYAGGVEFLAAFADDRPGCLVLDVRMPDMDGLELQRMLAARGSLLPIIILTGHGDVPMAVGALHAGALDFIQKPFESKVLLQRVQEALEHNFKTRNQNNDQATNKTRLSRLSPRENEVLARIVEGMPTKAIAAIFGTSFNTVQNQRASILKKMEAESTADLVRMVMTARAGDE
ncbi:MAG: response regulator transcription factor [Planctomycetaceae bacterium]|nr:response regulator transcription factor [Planctomycetaceae bacterium]